MPELYSRMDSVNWLTPAIVDILDQGANPPGGTGSGSIREHMLTIQRELSDLETPARIVNVRSSPSYHLFVARPEMVGRMGNRRQVTAEDIEKSVEKIAEAHPDWTLGFMPALKGEDQAVGILMRTIDHRPQSLRRLLVRDTFRKHPATTAFTCGITLEQQVIIRDLAEIGHLLVAGKESARQHIVQGILLSLSLLNTPGELRLALAGETAKTHKVFAGIPHALGRLLSDAVAGQRLLQGLVKEVQRRQQALQEDHQRTLAEYNARQRERQRPELPRILMVLDSLSDAAWQAHEVELMPLVIKLLQEGSKVGVHLLITIDEFNTPDYLRSLHGLILTRLVLRQTAREIFKEVPVHRSQLRFIDAFLVEGRLDHRKDIRTVPIEICAISAVEIKRAIEYWRGNARQRQTEATTGSVLSSSVISGRTGVTGILRSQDAELILPRPPVPDKPAQRTLERAAQALRSEAPPAAPAPARRATVDETLRAVAPDARSLEIHKPNESPAALEASATLEAILPPTIEAPAPPPLNPAPTPTLTLAPADALNGSHAPAEETITADYLNADLQTRAIALAAYLGWLSVGALEDILGLPAATATLLVIELKRVGILENAETNTPRFVRLAQRQEDPGH
ncbi:MAG: hypothetical protein MUE40_19880 [Anaerolineae bacterium]|nr:hypothetical protein [Anaerolineae bacterium]